MTFEALKIEEQITQSDQVPNATHCAMMARRRFLATFVDICVVQGIALYIAPLIAYAFLLGSESEFHRLHADTAFNLFFDSLQYGFFWVWGGSSLVLWASYSVAGFCFYGKSFGSALLGLKLVTPSGANPSAAAVIVRSLFFALSLFLMGIPLLAMVRRRELKAWHDHASSTQFELAD